jgi:hypothetical protein
MNLANDFPTNKVILVNEMKMKILITIPLIFASQTYRQNFLEAYDTARVILVILLRHEEETEQCSFFSCLDADML